MKRKIIALCMCLLLSCSLFCGCTKDGEAKVTPLPVATPNPDITHPEGRYYEAEGEKKAEGGLSVLGDDFMKVMIEGNEIEFALTENAQWEISIYNKDKNNPRLMQGTMLLITYTERDLVKYAETMDIINAN